MWYRRWRNAQAQEKRKKYKLLGSIRHRVRKHKKLEIANCSRIYCVPVVLSEAKEQSKAAADHFAHMVVHGVLHLLGHDHDEPDAASRMEALELRILAEFGVQDPYAQ